MRTVVWSNGALSDMETLAAHIAADNPGVALDVLDRIEEAVHSLLHISTGRVGRVTGTYEKVVRSLPYIIAYALQRSPTGEERVVVLRVIHGAREWLRDEWPK